MTAATLRTAKTLLDKLHEKGVSYCHWKNNHALEEALEGEDDLDLLVADKDHGEFILVIQSMGFKEAFNRQTHIDGISHFYGLDPETGKFLHLHVHTRVVTGESHTKNYHLPVETMILDNLRRHPSGCNIPVAEVELIVFLLRYFIKVSCIPGMLLLRKRKEYVAREYAHIVSSTDLGRAKQIVEGYAGFISPSLFERLCWTYSWPALLSHVLLGLELRWSFRKLRRKGWFRSLWDRYFQLGYRVFNRFVLKRRKSLSAGGRMIAVTGLDGTGKTTVCSELTKWLEPIFNVRGYHVGRPPAVPATWGLRAILYLRNSRRESHENRGPNVYKKNIAFALRYLALAYERYRCLKAAEKCKNKGWFSICDRYPSLNFGAMDSPKIGETDGRAVYNLLGRWERRLYEAMPVPDAIFNLKVSCELAQERNRSRTKPNKESAVQIETRYRKFADLRYKAAYYQECDASRDLHDLVTEMKNKVWYAIAEESLRYSEK